MPIPKDKRRLYPANWKVISARIRNERARGLCECRGHCGADHPGVQCSAPNGVLIERDLDRPWLWNRANMTCEDDGEGLPIIMVVLTVAHLDRNPASNDDSNLLAMCQRCHLVYDLPQHKTSARHTRDRKRGQMTLAAIVGEFERAKGGGA